MGNFTKTNPVGIDVYIQNLQNSIYEFGKVEWSVIDEEWNSYGRIYRNFDGEGKEYLPYPFDSNEEYINPPFFEDTIKINSFFDILETQKISSSAQSSMKVVFYMFADLVKLYPDELDRFDEQFSNDVASFVQQKFGFILTGKKVGIKTIMKDWSGYAQQKMMKADYQPFYAFSLEFEINEYYTCYMQPSTQYVQPDYFLIPYTRYNPKGIDQWIQTCQISLYNFILLLFDGSRESQYGMKRIENNEYNCFGRVYRNYSGSVGGSGGGGNYIPQAFVKLATTGNFDYVNVMFEDTVAIQSFFDVGEVMREESEEGLMTYVNIHLYFFLDLQQVYTSLDERMDEEFIVMMSQFIMENSGFTLYAIQRGIKAVTSEYSGEMLRKIKTKNMQPYLCFRMDMLKYYDESFNNCPILIPSGREHQFNPQEFDPTQFQ